MENKDLGTVGSVSNMLMSNSVLVEIGGSIKRIPLGDLRDVINAGGENILRQIAWGIEIMEWQSSTNWNAGKVGNYLMWQEFESMCGNYVLHNSGKMAKLKPDTGTAFIDGTPMAAHGEYLNRMYYQPKTYYLVKTNPENGKTYVWQSLYNIGGKELPRICAGSNKGYISNLKLRSVSQQAPTHSKTITEFWNAAQLNGKDFGITDYNFRKALALKCLFKFGNTNIQTSIGNGMCGNTSADLQAVANIQAERQSTDAYASYPMTLAGGSSCSQVSVGGIMNPYGWQWEMCQGIYCGSSANPLQDSTEVFIYEGNRLPTAAELLDKPTGKYRKVSRISTGASGFIKEMLIGDEFDIIPKNITGGSSASYWSDTFHPSSSGQILSFGYAAGSGLSSGVFSINTTQSLNVYDISIGARLAYYGPIEFVNGKDLPTT